MKKVSSPNYKKSIPTVKEVVIVSTLLRGMSQKTWSEAGNQGQFSIEFTELREPSGS